MQTLDQISMKFETWAIFMSLYGMVCQKDIGSISPYPRGISANPFKKKYRYAYCTIKDFGSFREEHFLLNVQTALMIWMFF